MKKIAAVLILAIFLTSSNTKPAEALILDPLQLATKVSGYLEKIKESVDKITQQINQIKLMSTQGFTLDELKTLAEKYVLTDKVKATLKNKLKKIVKNAKAKKKKAQEDKMKWDKETKLRMYNDKLNVAKKDLEVLKESLSGIMQKLNEKYLECWDLNIEWQIEQDYDVKVIKHDAYEDCETEAEELEYQKLEQQTRIDQYEEIIKDLQNRINEVNSGDADYKEMKEMLNAIENAGDSEDIVEADEFTDKDEWDNAETMSKFTLGEGDYTKFINRYFYDPASIKGEGSKGMIDYQSKMDRVTRERRFLMVNTAIHLLQVVTSVRREIPVQAHNLEAYANQTSYSKDELEARSAYAATRIENAKALLLYARILSAKLQYIAARDLLNETLAKEINDPTGKEKLYEPFDLGKYILTPEFIKYRLEQANPEQDLVDKAGIE